MGSKMILRVEFLPGTDVYEAVFEAKEKALIWDVAYVEFQFNGTIFAIGRNADVVAAVEEYHKHEVHVCFA